MRPLEQAAEIETGDALGLLRRALRFVSPFRARFAAKAALTVVSLLPVLALPWPAKLLIDHGVLHMPIDAPTTPHPALVRWLLAPLAGASTVEILIAMTAAQLALIALVGGFGTDPGQQHRTPGTVLGASGALAQGRDDATRSENQANQGFSFASGLLGLLDFRFTIRLTQALNHHYRARLFERIQQLPLPAFDDERIGDAVYRVMYDTPVLTDLCYRLLITPVVAPLQLALTVAVLLAVYPAYPEIVWLACSFLGLVFAVTLPLARVVRRRAMLSRGAGATTTATVEEGMANIVAVQSLGTAGREQQRFDRDSWSSFGAYRDYALAVIGVSVAIGAGAIALSILAFFFISERVIEGALSPGDFTLMFGYFYQIGGYASALGRMWIDVQGNTAGLNRVFFLMDVPGEQDAKGARPLPPVRQGIALEHVRFAYAGGALALDDVSLEIPVGQVTALVGSAGAGKTTLAYLIPRFLVPTSGRVCIDGVDTAGVALGSLRAQIAFVFQETALFDASVADNLRLGRPDASDAELVRACEIAGAHEFVCALPQSYETRLGRGGGKLSVGQKQRLAIARALVRDARILILDEPTSALDPETEQRLVAALREASRERAVLVIAHRLATIRAADQICCLERGRIVERGTHAELMARPQGSYRHFVEVQERGAA
jgi:ABC-type multidrug transport system fused ATPase/permease subunit